MENTFQLGTLMEEVTGTSDLLNEKLNIREKKVVKRPAEEILGTARGKETSRTKDSVSTTSGLDEPGYNEDPLARFVPQENTYQLRPPKHFPVNAATDILKEVLTGYLQEEKYEAQRARELSLTMCTVIRERVKELKIPRYKIVALVSIGHPLHQGMQISSRCLWNETVDTFTCYSFKNSSVFGVGTIYAVSYE